MITITVIEFTTFGLTLFSICIYSLLLYCIHAFRILREPLDFVVYSLLGFLGSLFLFFALNLNYGWITMQ